jgi:hypothetical protein
MARAWPVSPACAAPSGAPHDPDHAAHASPGRGRTDRFSGRHRWAGRHLPAAPGGRSVQRRAVHLPQPRTDSDQDPRCPSGKAAKRPGQGRRKPPAIKYLHFQLTFHAQIGYGAAHAHAPEGPTPADFRRRSRLHPPVDRRSSGVESQDRVEAGV